MKTKPTNQVESQHLNVLRALRSVIRAEVALRVHQTGDYTRVKRAQARLEAALGRSEVPTDFAARLMRDVKSIGEIC